MSIAGASVSRVRLITTYSQFDLAMSDSNAVVVILFTVPGCPHCNRFLPEYNTLSVERSSNNVSFYNVNLMSGDGMGIARRSKVAGVPHTVFYNRGVKLGEMRGDSMADFKKLLNKYQQDHAFVGAGYTLGSEASREAPRAMGNSRDANADALERKAPSRESVDKLLGMGFERDRVMAALQRAKNDEDGAADILSGGGSAEDKAWLAGVHLPTAGEAAARSEAAGRSAVLCGVGLGLADHWDNTGARVSDIMPHSPAAESKVFSKGDRVVSIDGVDVRGRRVDDIKPLILGQPGTVITVGFIPANPVNLRGSLFSFADLRGARGDVVLVQLQRGVRLETAPAARSAGVSGGGGGDDAPKKPWYNTVWEDIKAGADKMTKGMESGLISTGDKIVEGGSAVGTTAKAGWDATAANTNKAAKTVKEASAVAGERISESAAKVKVAAGVDGAARDRVAQLEEENRLLREKLRLQEEAASPLTHRGESTTIVVADSPGYAAHQEQEDEASPAVGERPRRVEVEEEDPNAWKTRFKGVNAGDEARSFDAKDFTTAKSTKAAECTIKLRMLDGTVVQHIFPSSATIGEVVRSALPALAQRKEYTLMTPYPRKVFVGADLEVSLSAACLVPAATLNVTRVPNV